MTACDAVGRYLEAAIGLDVESVGSRRLEAVVAARMRACGLGDAAAYCSLLERDPAERGELVEEIVVPETWFFRDRGPFELLASLCAGGELTASHARPLRVLSLPCATGEEPYSIAMALVDAGLHPAWLEIDALDISSRALAKARQALYGPSSFRGPSGPWRGRYFAAEGGAERLQAPIAGLVRFARANIFGPGFPLAPGKTYRIIFCRNLLIYLTQEARKRVFERLDSLLEPGGLLVAGHTEVLLFEQFGYEPMAHRAAFACTKPQGAARAAASGPSARPRKAPVRPRRSPGRQSAVFAGLQPAAADNGNPLGAVRALADRGELEKAEARCARLLQGPAGLDARAHCLMGEICQARNRPDAAEECFLRAVYLDPDCYGALVHLSLLYEHRGSRDRAQRYRQRARRLHKDTA